MRSRTFAVAALAGFLSLGTASCGNSDKKEDKEMAPNPMDGPVVEMQTSCGTMRIKLYNATPRHRDNFVKLVEEGFYDKVRFHRVINGFMIQGGDPLSKVDTLRAQWGTGGPGYTIEAEFRDSLHHCKGAVAAARMGDMANPRRASSGSQFYIVQSEDGCRHLDGQYTVFGQVIEGLDVIDKIASAETDPYDRPLADVFIMSASVEKPVEPVDSTQMETAGTQAETVMEEEKPAANIPDWMNLDDLPERPR